MPSNSTAGALRLSDYVVLLRRQWRSVLAGVLVGGLLAVGYLAVTPQQFTARTAILVTLTTPPDSGSGGARASQINLDTEAQLVQSTDTVTAAAAYLDFPPDDLAELADRVSVTVPPNTEILTIAYVGPTARAARDGADAFGRAYLQLRGATAEAALDAESAVLASRVESVTAQVEQVTEAGERLAEGSPERVQVDERIAALTTQLASLVNQQNRLEATPITPGRVITEAAAPGAPSSPDPLLALVAGVLLGLLGGLGVAALRDRFDDRIRSGHDLVRRTDVRPLAVLAEPVDDRGVVLVPGGGADGRAYGRLRNEVTAALDGSRRRTVVVTAVRRGCGPVAANLAASLASLGEDVYLLCADAAASTAEDLLGARPREGLAEVLDGTATLERAARALPGLPTLHVLSLGYSPQPADGLLETKGLRRVVDQIAQSAAYLVIETPPTERSAAAQTLAPVTDAAVLVVERGATTARDVTDAQVQFGAVRRQVLGAVLVPYRAQVAGRPDDGAPAGSRHEPARSAALRPEPARR